MKTGGTCRRRDVDHPGANVAAALVNRVASGR